MAEARFSLNITLRLGALHLRARVESHSATVVVAGPSGAGKSTLLRVIAGLERRVEGRVSFAGQRWSDSATGIFLPAHHRRAAWVPQDALLFPHLSVAENLGFAAADPSEVPAMAERLRVAPLLDRRPRHLSGGERQRVAVGRALLARPPLLLLDEPFSALDRSLRQEMVQVVGRWCREHDIPRVLVSHDEADHQALGDELWMVSEGLVGVEGRN